MKKVIFASLILSFILVAIAASQGTQTASPKHAQISTPEGANVNFVADNIQRQDQTLQLSGNVEIRTREMALYADNATYDQNTAEIKATGNVRIKLETQN